MDNLEEAINKRDLAQQRLEGMIKAVVIEAYKTQHEPFNYPEFKLDETDDEIISRN